MTETTALLSVLRHDAINMAVSLNPCISSTAIIELQIYPTRAPHPTITVLPTILPSHTVEAGHHPSVILEASRHPKETVETAYHSKITVETAYHLNVTR